MNTMTSAIAPKMAMADNFIIFSRPDSGAVMFLSSDSRCWKECNRSTVLEQVVRGQLFGWLFTFAGFRG